MKMRNFLCLLLCAVLVLGNIPVVSFATSTEHTHPICGNGCACTFDTHGDETWEPWDGTTKMYGGYYYLTQDVVLDSTMILDYSYTTYLCLNGHRIFCEDTVFNIYSYRSLVITDCVGTGAVESTDTWCTISNSNNLAIWGGSILNTQENNGMPMAIEVFADTNTCVYGGSVSCANGPAIFTLPGSNIEVHGGTVHGGNGNAAIYSNGDGSGRVGSILISGGRITSTQRDLVIAVPDGDFTMTGGYVGGSIDISGGGSTIIRGGTIDGELYSYNDKNTITGGNVTGSYYGLFLTGEATISAGSFGGSYSRTGANTTITGGDFTDSAVLLVTGETWISGGSYAKIRVEDAPLYLSDVPEIESLQVGYPATVSAQSPDGTGSFGGGTIEVILGYPEGSAAWKAGDIVIQNVKTDAAAEKFVLGGEEAAWMELERSGNNLVLQDLPYGTCGDNLTWSLKDGTLTISGTGDMYDYDYEESSNETAPWYDIRDQISSVVVEDGVTSVGNHAFYFCDNLTNVVLPASVARVGDWAMAWNDNLESVTFKGTAPAISSETFMDTGSRVDGGTTCYYPANDSAWDNVINQYYGSPINWVPVDGGISGQCGDNLTWTLTAGTLTISGTGDMYDYAYVFTSGETYTCSAPWYDVRDQISTVIINVGATSIGDYAFADCNNLSNITIPEGIVSIGKNAFYACSRIASIELPSTLTTIKEDAFSICTNLTDISIPQAVTSIGQEAFSSCYSLTSIEIPENITNIEDYTFLLCSGLTEMTIPKNVTRIGVQAFSSCDGLTNITIPDNVERIEMQAFSSCSSLNEITFIGTAPVIVDFAFEFVTATCYYPANDPSWANVINKDYGGELTWIPVGEENDQWTLTADMLYVAVGETVRLEALGNDGEPVQGEYCEWYLSDASLAQLSGNGYWATLYARAPGTVKVTLETALGDKSVDIVIEENLGTPSDPAIALGDNNLVGAGSTVQATFTPPFGSDEYVFFVEGDNPHWSISFDQGAEPVLHRTYGAWGYRVVLQEGITYNVQIQNDSGADLRVRMMTISPDAPDLSFPRDTLDHAYVGDNWRFPVLPIPPDGKLQGQIRWTNTDDTVVTMIPDGDRVELKFIGEGTVTITAEDTVSGKTAKQTFTVYKGQGGNNPNTIEFYGNGGTFEVTTAQETWSTDGYGYAVPAGEAMGDYVVSISNPVFWNSNRAFTKWMACTHEFIYNDEGEHIGEDNIQIPGSTLMTTAEALQYPARADGKTVIIVAQWEGSEFDYYSDVGFEVYGGTLIVDPVGDEAPFETPAPGGRCREDGTTIGEQLWFTIPNPPTHKDYGFEGWLQYNEDTGDLISETTLSFTQIQNLIVPAYNVRFIAKWSGIDMDTYRNYYHNGEGGEGGDVTIDGYVAGITSPAEITAADRVLALIKVSHSEDTHFAAGEVVVSYDSSMLTFNETASNLGTATVKDNNGTLILEDYGADKQFANTGYVLAFDPKTTGMVTLTLESAAFVDKENAVKSDLIEATLDPASAVVMINKEQFPVNLDPIFTGPATATAGESYTFCVADGKHYVYDTVSAVMNGVAADVIDHGDGTYTVENVTGTLMITGSRTEKVFKVTLEGNAAEEITNANPTATYGVEYVFDIPSGDGVTYRVDRITIDGQDYTDYMVTGNTYTIDGMHIHGDIVITVTKTTAEASVTVEGNGAGAAAGYETKLDLGKDYTLVLKPQAGYTYEVTATMDGKPAVVIDNGDNTYTIEKVTGDIVFTVTRTLVTDSVTVTQYLKINGANVWMVKFTAEVEDGKVPTYDGNPMFWSDEYDAYCYLVITEVLDEAEAKTKIDVTDGTAVVIGDSMDVNFSGKVDASDAQLVYNMYNAMYTGFGGDVTVEKYLRADVNKDGEINVQDAAAIIAHILA